LADAYGFTKEYVLYHLSMGDVAGYLFARQHRITMENASIDEPQQVVEEPTLEQVVGALGF
jgi:hypothetical protein